MDHSSNAPEFATGLTRLLHPGLPGLLLGILTLLFGFGLGVAFGLNEDAIKGRLKSSAAAARETVYKSDDAAIKPVLDKSWTYMQRAHLHAGALGTNAIALTLLACMLGAPTAVTRVLGLALGLGGLGYSVYWMWAGFLAPGLGSTGAAKETLKWLAIPSSGAVVLGTLGVAVLVAAALARTRTHR